MAHIYGISESLRFHVIESKSVSNWKEKQSFGKGKQTVDKKVIKTKQT